MSDALIVLGLLCLFDVAGGVAVGGTLRSWRQGGFSVRSVFSLVWGMMFAGFPLCIGLAAFWLHEVPQLVLVQLGVLLLTIALSVLIPDSFLDSFRTPEFGVVVGGGLFLVVGVGVAATMIRTAPRDALVTLCIFGGFGGFALAAGVARVLKRP